MRFQPSTVVHITHHLLRIYLEAKSDEKCGALEMKGYGSKKSVFCIYHTILMNEYIIYMRIHTYTWIFQICKISAFWLGFWLKRHKFYTLGRSRYIHIYLCVYVATLDLKVPLLPFFLKGVFHHHRGSRQTENPSSKTSEVFAAGDCRRGQSLVVWAIKAKREPRGE